MEGFRQPPENGNTRRYATTFDRSDVTTAQSSSVGQFFLSHFTCLPLAAQVDRKDVLQVHRADDHVSGTILLGTIVPIRYTDVGIGTFGNRQCRLLKRLRRMAQQTITTGYI